MKTNRNALSLTQIGSHSRQGDTLLRRRASSIPAEVKQTKSPTLALGEISGHHHTFRDGGAVGFADDEEAQTADFIRVCADQATLTHEEHEPIIFPKGDYESLKQVEDSEEEVRKVQD